MMETMLAFSVFRLDEIEINTVNIFTTEFFCLCNNNAILFYVQLKMRNDSIRLTMVNIVNVATWFYDSENPSDTLP